jgi:RNA polymerase sigma-70 factor (ECF subfamily)
VLAGSVTDLTIFKQPHPAAGLLGIVGKETPIVQLLQLLQPLPPGQRRAAAELAQRSDDELMTLAAAGLVEAFSELVRRYERPVRGLCGKILGGRAEGDDVAQEVFLELWRTRGRYEERGRFRAFLFTTARNRSLNEAITAHDLAPAVEHIDALLAAERRQQLQRLVQRLPPKLRDAIWLRFSAELEYAEIAAIVHRPEETVRSRVFLALKRLRRLIDGGREGSLS